MGAIAERIPLHLDGLSAEQLEVFTDADWKDWKERRRQYWIDHPPKQIDLAQRWASELAEQDLAVISSDAIAMRRVNDFPFLLTKVAVYRPGYRYGSIVNSGYMLKTISTRKTEIVRCPHIELEDVRDELAFFICPTCHRFPDPQGWISRRAINIIRPDIDPEMPWKESGLWRDKRHTKIPWNWQERDGGELELQEYAGEWTNVRFSRRQYRRRFTFDRSDGWTERVAAEIDQRRRESAFQYELQNPPYRAPHKKVLELRDAGLEINRIARKLKVSPSTIDNRLREVPESVPRADLLALRVKASGGYMRPAFWPGADNIPRGYRHPWHLDRPLARIFPPVLPGPSTPAGNRLEAVREKRAKKTLREIIDSRRHAPYDVREENVQEWRAELREQQRKKEQEILEKKLAAIRHWKSLWTVERAPWTLPDWKPSFTAQSTAHSFTYTPK